MQVRQRAEGALIVADRRKDEFLAMLAHELIANPRHLAGAEPQARALWLASYALFVRYTTAVTSPQEWEAFREAFRALVRQEQALLTKRNARATQQGATVDVLPGNEHGLLPSHRDCS